MEKFYYRTDSAPSIKLLSGKLITYPTSDRRVRMGIVVGEFKWAGKEKEEVKVCPICRSFIMPNETDHFQIYHPSYKGGEK
jgi:hypothetical protein